jgi:hypothetical protein
MLKDLKSAINAFTLKKYVVITIFAAFCECSGDDETLKTGVFQLSRTKIEKRH